MWFKCLSVAPPYINPMLDASSRKVLLFETACKIIDNCSQIITKIVTNSHSQNYTNSAQDNKVANTLVTEFDTLARKPLDRTTVYSETSIKTTPTKMWSLYTGCLYLQVQ